MVSVRIALVLILSASVYAQPSYSAPTYSSPTYSSPTYSTPSYGTPSYSPSSPGTTSPSATPPPFYSSSPTGYSYYPSSSYSYPTGLPPSTYGSVVGSTAGSYYLYYSTGATLGSYNSRAIPPLTRTPGPTPSTVSSAVSATYVEGESSSIFYTYSYPWFGDELDYTARRRVAIFSVKFDKPIYANRDCGPSPYCNATTPMYGVCCPLTGCFGNIRLDVPENPPNCRCSIDPEWPCVNVTSNDDSWIVNATRRNPSQPEGTGPVHYLIPIENICGSLMVHVDSLSGDFDLSTLVIYGPRDRDLVLNQVTYGSTMFLCTFFNNSSEDTLSLFNPTTRRPAKWVLIRVRPKASGVARVQVMQSPLNGRFVLPVNRYSDVVRKQIKLTCPGPDRSLIPSLVFPMPPYPDPLLYYFGQRTGVLGEVDPMTLPDNEFTFALLLGETTEYYADIFRISPSDCSLTISFLYDVATRKRQSTPLSIPYFPPKDLPDCDPARYAAVASQLEATANAYDETLPTDAESVARLFAATDALSRSETWESCVDWARNSPTFTSETRAKEPVYTDLCLAPLLSTDYANDPCCNRTLEYFQCCTPRNVTPIVVAGIIDDDYLSSSCQTPKCSHNAAQDFLKALNPTSSCDAPFFALFQDPRLTVNRRFDEAAVCASPSSYGNPCQSDADCSSGWSCDYRPEVQYCIRPFNLSTEVQCLLTQTPTRILSDIYFQIGLTGRETVAQKETALLAAIASTGCQVHIDDSRASLNSNQTDCTNYGYFCNWGTYPSSPPVSRRIITDDPALRNSTWTYECTQIPYLSANFCASYCTPDGACYEASHFTACFDLRGADETNCTSEGGAWTRLAGDYWDRFGLPEFGCYFSAYTTEAACTTNRPEDSSGQSYSTKATCEAQGFCNLGGGLTQAECLALTGCTFPCNASSGCNATYCETAGTCSDTRDLLPGGSCILPPPLDPLGFPLTCYYETATAPPFAAAIGLDLASRNYEARQAAFGCKWIDLNTGTDIPVNQTVCEAFNGVFLKLSTNRTDCLAFKVCQTIKGYSVKNATECAKCDDGQGQLVSAYTWSSPPAPIWTPWKWLPRQVLEGNTYGPGANLTKFRDLKNPTFFRLASQAAKTAALCKYQSLIAPLRLLSCDCLSNTSVDCYNQILPSFVGITHMCSYQANSFYSAPVGLTTSDTSVFTVSSVVGCTDIQLQLLTASRYFTSKATIYSSLFLDSIKTAPNAVVKNKNGIIVGAIIGDAAIVSYDGNATELILCLDIDESADTSGFPVFDFASADPVTYSVDSFRPRFINVTYNDTTTPKKLCTMISGIGLPAQVYLPIKRFSDARTATFRDTLTTAQQNAFFVATALYLACFIWAIFRLGNIFLWTYVQRGQKFYLQKIILSLLFVFFLLRFLYFILVPFGQMRKAPLVIDLLMAELPTYIFFTIFTLMVLWWVELYHNATALQTSLLGRLKWLFIGINAFLYLFLIIVVAVYAARVNKKEIALCGDSGSRDEVSINLTKAYKVIVSAIAFVLALGFMVYGTILIRRMTGLAHNARDKLIKFALVGVACTVGLLLQCALLLYSTFKKSGSSTSTIVAIILVLIVELLPGGILLATIRQPRAEGVDTWWQDFIWCFYLKASAETLSSRRRTSNSQRPTSATTEGASNTPTASNSGIESGAPTSKF